jgi:hypothetical protein
LKIAFGKIRQGAGGGVCLKVFIVLLRRFFRGWPFGGRLFGGWLFGGWLFGGWLLGDWLFGDWLFGG